MDPSKKAARSAVQHVNVKFVLEEEARVIVSLTPEGERVKVNFSVDAPRVNVKFQVTKTAGGVASSGGADGALPAAACGVPAPQGSPDVLACGGGAGDALPAAACGVPAPEALASVAGGGSAAGAAPHAAAGSTPRPAGSPSVADGADLEDATAAALACASAWADSDTRRQLSDAIERLPPLCSLKQAPGGVEVLVWVRDLLGQQQQREEEEEKEGHARGAGPATCTLVAFYMDALRELLGVLRDQILLLPDGSPEADLVHDLSRKVRSSKGIVHITPPSFPPSLFRTFLLVRSPRPAPHAPHHTPCVCRRPRRPGLLGSGSSTAPTSGGWRCSACAPCPAAAWRASSCAARCSAHAAPASRRPLRCPRPGACSCRAAAAAPSHARWRSTQPCSRACSYLPAPARSLCPQQHTWLRTPALLRAGAAAARKGAAGARGAAGVRRGLGGRAQRGRRRQRRALWW